MPDSEVESLLKPWVGEPFSQLPSDIQTIVWQLLPQRRDPRYLLPPRRFVSSWDDLGENDRLKAARHPELMFELGFRKHPDGSGDIDARFIDNSAWEISRFGNAAVTVPRMEPVNDGGDESPPEIPTSLSPMELAAYAATNNPWLIARCAPDGLGCDLLRLERRAFDSGYLSPTRVLEKAVDILRAGNIVMTALQDGVRREMLAEDWRYWTFRTSPLDKNGLVVCEVTTREPIAGWTNFLISREHAEQVRVELLGREAASGLAAAEAVSHRRRQLGQAWPSVPDAAGWETNPEPSMLKLETNLHGGEPYDAMAEDSGQSVTPADKNWIPDNVSAEAFKVVKNKAGGGGKVRQKVLDEMYPGRHYRGYYGGRFHSNVAGGRCQAVWCKSPDHGTRPCNYPGSPVDRGTSEPKKT